MEKLDIYQSADSELEISSLEISDDPEQVGLSKNLSMDIWMPYADLMSLLLIFFIFFYINSDFKKEKIIEEKTQLLLSKTKLDSLLRRNEEVITIPSEILFESGKADLGIKAKEELKKIGEKIANIIQNDADWAIRIEGHTDNVPILGGKYESNWDLSTARAIIIVKYFMENDFFPADQMQAMGYGEFEPIEENDTAEHRRMNRRVEIKVSRKYY